jgi:hypothetical protein
MMSTAGLAVLKLEEPQFGCMRAVAGQATHEEILAWGLCQGSATCSAPQFALCAMSRRRNLFSYLDLGGRTKFQTPITKPERQVTDFTTDFDLFTEYA